MKIETKILKTKSSLIYLLIFVIMTLSVTLFTMQTEVTNFLKALYQSSNETELSESLIKLFEFLNKSKVDIPKFIQKDLDISKVDLLASYKNNFDKMCEQEVTLDRDTYFETASFYEFRNLRDLLNTMSETVKNYVNNNPESVTQNIDQILNILKNKIINFMFFSSFEQFKNKNCPIAIYKIIDVLGIEILESDKDYSVNQKELINLKNVFERNNKIINNRLHNLAIELIYNYLKSNNRKDVKSLLDRLSKKGFDVQSLIHDLAQAIARFFRDHRAIVSYEQAGDKESKKTLDEITSFINDDIMKSNYKFDNYPKLIDEYLRAYKLMNLMTIPRAEQFVILLLNEGVQINARDFNGNSALVYAIENDKLPYIKLLMKFGADINLGVRDGVTPLMKAVHNLKATELLLTYKPDLSQKDIYGDNIWSLAERNSEIENLLKNYQHFENLNSLRELSSILHSLGAR